MLKRNAGGAVLVEWLIVGPVVLVLGLLMIQVAMLWSARHALDYAALQALRHATVDHARHDAIADGLARGLHAFWGLSQRKASQRVHHGERIGWIAWRRSDLTQRKFEDFAQLTRSGNTMVRQVPNANLRYASNRIGARSGKTVHDANHLRLHIEFGLPLTVPLVGPIIARLMQIADGCVVPTQMVIGLLSFGHATADIHDRRWACPMYQLPVGPGEPAIWRLPVRVTVQGWMQSPLRAN